VTADPQRWLRIPAGARDPAVRLVCFPAAGSGPAMFLPWRRLLPPWVELILVHLPGREARIGETMPTTVQDVVDPVVEALLPLLDRPWAVLGHSMGARVAFAVTQALAEQDARPPMRLFATGCAAPDVLPVSVAAAPRTATGPSDRELVSMLRDLGGTSSAVMQSPELLNLVLPALRADLCLIDATGAPRTPLEVPISVLGGDQDDLTGDQLAQWPRWSTRPVEVQMFPGGHFFLVHESAEAVVAFVVAVLAQDAADVSVPP
jgi:pyochelin biosynthesis protein PchC